MNLTQQLKNQKEQNAKIVGENYQLNKKVEELQTKIFKNNYDFENEKRKAERLKEQNLKLEGAVNGLELVIRILTNKESNPPF
jgi:chromosome segregation ATPase